MPLNLLHRAWPACLLLWAAAAAAAPVLAPAVEDYGVFEGDLPLALQDPGAQVPSAAQSAQRLADAQWRDSDLGLADAPPLAEVLIDMPEPAPMRRSGASTAPDSAALFRRPLEPLADLPERPVEPLLTAAMQRIDTTPENRDLRPADDRANLRWLLPAELIQFVRENRPWVLGGGAGLLLLIWIGSAMLSRRPD